MFYRLLGKFFFLFYVCPAFARTARFVFMHASKQGVKMLAEEITKKEEQADRSRVHRAAESRRT